MPEQQQSNTQTSNLKPQHSIIRADKRFLGGLGHWVVGRWLVMASLRRAFSQVHLKMRPAPDVPLPSPRLDRPAVFYVNHSSWWDGYMAYLVVDQYLKLDGYLMMDVRQLRKYFFFTWVGTFSVDRFNPRGAVESINYAVETLEAAPGRSLFIFPQGEIQGSHRRPLDFYNGAAQVARKLQRCYLYPVALRYEFMTNQFPDVFISIGPGHLVDDEHRPDAKTLTNAMNTRLIVELDSIAACINAAQFGTPEDERASFAGFKTIMRGKGSANNRFEKIFGVLLPKEDQAGRNELRHYG
jgi:chlorobactene lauroyltransferase